MTVELNVPDMSSRLNRAEKDMAKAVPLGASFVDSMRMKLLCAWE